MNWTNSPVLVHLVPLPTLGAFWLVTLVGLAAATFALMWFLRGYGLSHGACIAGGCAFVCLTPATGWTLFDDVLVDPLAYALLTLALAACVHRIGWLVAVSLTLCALDKETALFGVAFALIWSYQQRDRLMVRWSLVSMGSVLLVFVSLHIFLPATSSSSLLQSLVVFTALTLMHPVRLLLALVGTWGVLLPLAISARNFWCQRACWLFLLLATFQVFISGDIERVVVYAFPVMIAASCACVEDLANCWHISRWWFWVPILALELSWPYTYGQDYFFTLEGLRLPLMGLFLIATVSIVCIKIRVWHRARQVSANNILAGKNRCSV